MNKSEIVEAIKLTIDYAAAGHDVTAKIDAYKPRPWKSISKPTARQP